MSEAVALLKHEMQKQRRHLPLRELLARAGKAVQAVKPVFMMSPLSVAQYLEPGVLEFDMLLIDEASQVRPVEAWELPLDRGRWSLLETTNKCPRHSFSVARPWRCGRRTRTGNAGRRQWKAFSVCRRSPATPRSECYRRWHYRSKHESLIAVSNREFYDNQLCIVPSPERSGELGVKWSFVEGGIFVKGKNDSEAKVVAEAIMQHAPRTRKVDTGRRGLLCLSATQS